MRMRRTAILTVAAAAFTIAGIAPAGAATGDGPATTWTADLASGEAAGVTADGSAVALDPGTAFAAPADDQGLTEGGPDPTGVVPTGLLTLAPRTLDTPTSQVSSVLDADVPAGTSASMDVRGRTASGGWTEWIPATASGADSGTVTLPVATDEVQGRLVLTGTSAGAVPTVRGAQLSATPSIGGTEGGLAETAPFTANVFATREGLVGGTTANGHVITERDHFVALPSRRALSPRDTSDYSVRVCAPNGRCAFAPVWDVGPWNTRDDYWNPADRRQEWKDLPQGVPQAQAAFRDGYNGGNDQFGRKAVNPAGIDLGDGVFWDALGLKDNSQVQVDYLWTGSVRLSKVSAEASEDGVAQVFSAPDEAASVVGVAADSADVPVECLTGAWARIGDEQFVSAAVLPDASDAPACDAVGGVAGEVAAAPSEKASAAAFDAMAPTQDASPEDSTPGSTPSETAAGSTAGSGTAGSASAGSATAGSGTAGPASAGPASAGPATAGSATAGSAAAGSGTAGSGTADPAASSSAASGVVADSAGSGMASRTTAGGGTDPVAGSAETGPPQAPPSAEAGGAAAVRAGAATVEQPAASG